MLLFKRQYIKIREQRRCAVGNKIVKSEYSQQDGMQWARDHGKGLQGNEGHREQA